MASSPHPRSKSSLEATLLYFSKYNYPLTSDELWFWQHKTSFSKLKIKKYYDSLGQLEQLEIRNFREQVSKQKWLIARKVGESLQRIPSIQAIFVTGSLAMSNCKEDADIDLMIITYPNTLWITRPLVFLLLHSIRRKPKVISAPDKICDNLYLDLANLSVSPHDIYRAHEILQAKCIFDRGGIHRQFLLANSWVEKYLPVAYPETLRPLGQLEIRSIRLIYYLLYPINIFLFCLQYFYMLPKMTTERVGPGFAFFHPAP